ncbi:MAG: Asp-tRNA(Asn)/Glu-tRNA(Gln) amidotransferase subunit GatC [Rickettsiella sp.]|nr:Asp-tRNA(Asn)/Glu-tRNA(Gln) amidotransferase subunit GatC [Rickettsiella sp.]
MTITLDDVNKVAELASLKIDKEEAKHYLENLQSILKLANQMETVDTESIQAIAHCFDIKKRLRPDKVTETNSRDYMQQLTESVQSGLYCVPPVIE